MNREELLQNIHDEWEKLTSLLSTFDDDKKLLPRFVGEWSLKDLLGHVSSWESVALERVGRMKRNEPIETIPDDKVDEWNKRFQEQCRDWRLIIVEGEFENVHARLIQEFGKLPGELWSRNEAKIAGWLPDCTFIHYRKHRAAIEQKLTAQKPRTTNQVASS
jgi:hypothetical protein